ncbi:uncharacterized protein OCT59_025623 [Rhizophagus irregularis]|uniref:Zn(2)-C6 fungal-type domain-containing protein n=1 Tax=Rhizophagus irregularis (strain DAOM 181602 / DAOM 197198 / MUCL 43194) TaxID=747089 RepID=U9UHW2_RHIID|nr:hypothetical protein OCT59_025623 [Rhizophagus irregularis]GBC11235.1 Zn(2)-C6 fungal-specific transcription factor [Rhizophagus irregularis DAOM 181602=DAOM 197198]
MGRSRLIHDIYHSYKKKRKKSLTGDCEGNDLNFPEIQQQQQELYTRKSVSVQTKPSFAELLSKRNMKREQVKCACVNCKKSCKKCDDERPCQRCIRLNIAETCRDSIRKERKLGKKVLIGEAGMKRSRLIREIYHSSSYVNVSRKNNKKSVIKNHVPPEEINLNAQESQPQQQELSNQEKNEVQSQPSLIWPTTERTTKREQVKCACVNCQKSRKKCDDKRPCQRCIDLNITETCKDSARKARRATKRGPYKHRVQQN